MRRSRRSDDLGNLGQHCTVPEWRKSRTLGIVESVWNTVHITTTSVVVVRSILDATVRQEWGRSWAGDKLVLEPPNYAAACQLRGGGAAFLV